jgi:hypothetical protein
MWVNGSVLDTAVYVVRVRYTRRGHFLTASPLVKMSDYALCEYKTKRSPGSGDLEILNDYYIAAKPRPVIT